MKLTHKMKKLYSKLQNLYYRYYWRLDDLYWVIKNYLTGKRYNIVKLGGKNLWRDKDMMVEQALERIFLSFIYEEKPFEHTDYEWCDESRANKKILLEILNFFECERAEWELKIENLNNLLYNKRDNGKDWFTQINNPTPEETELVVKSMKLEEDFENRKTEIFQKIIAIRRTLWT